MHKDTALQTKTPRADAPHALVHEHDGLGPHAHDHRGHADPVAGAPQNHTHALVHEHDGLGAHAHDDALNTADHTLAVNAEVFPHGEDHRADAPEHHRHSHAHGTRHDHGYHLLQVEDLCVSFRMYDADAPFFQATQRETEVIHNLTISVHAGEIVAVVGASGSGKTLLADAVMGLFEPNATVTGTVWFDGERRDAASLAALRGHGISLVPQSVNNLDPLMRVGKQVESFAHPGSERAARTARRRELFDRYGLDESVAKLYPFELSGGMARRVLLCCALMDEPKLIVADEPTPGLDLDLACKALADFRAFADEGGGVMLITHDIELALRVADRVAVFRDGTVIEETAVENFRQPQTLKHPFSRALWHALPEHGFVATDETELEPYGVLDEAGDAGAPSGGQAGDEEGGAAC